MLRKPALLAGSEVGYQFLVGKDYLRSEDLQCLDASASLGSLVW